MMFDCIGRFLCSCFDLTLWQAQSANESINLYFQLSLVFLKVNYSLM